MQYRLLALDVDGTLLDPDGVLRPAVQHAVAAARQRGLWVVLCTGRRFRSARPLAQALELEGPAIVHNGALVKDLASGDTLQPYYLPTTVYQHTLTVLRQFAAPLVYVDAYHAQVDIMTERPEHAHPFQRAYVQDNLAHCRFVDDFQLAPEHQVVMISIMADTTSLQTLRLEVEQTLDGAGHVNLLINKNYQGSILEILHPSVSKWQALEQLAAQEGIAPEAIIAVGDDYNDLEMIRHAGLGVAMGNAVEAVQAVADYVTGSNAEDGLVQALERFIL